MLKRDGVVVTATRRQAREISEGYSRQRVLDGDRAWRSPRVSAFDGWLRQCHEAIWLGGNATQGHFLNATQELALWERCVGAAAESQLSVQRQHALARMAMQSWRLAVNWEITPDTLATQGDATARQFADWAMRFQQQCNDQAWIASAHLADIVGAAFADGLIAPPPSIAFVGFERLSPQQLNLLRRVEAAGGKIVEPPQYPAANRSRRVAFASPGAELEAAAMWARQLVGVDPERRVGVVVSDLAARRQEVERVFADILTPGAILPGAGDGEGLFHVSLGPAGDTAPMIAQALLVLRIACRSIDYREAGRLLRSPFLRRAPKEACGRAAIDLEIRRRNWRRVDISKLRWLAEQADDSLATSIANLPAVEGSRLPSDWVTVFTAQLSAFGWPGERTPNSAEYQLLEYWHERLAEFASLDPVVGSLGVKSALSYLTRILQNNVFQVQDRGAPIEIMGSIEAAGLRFDHLWVTGLHDEAWPAPPRPDPLIPFSLQRKLDMPSSSIDNQLRHSRWLLSSYLAGAEDVMLSWPSRLEDRDMGPSPLLAHIAEDQAGEPAGPASYRRQQSQELGALESSPWDSPPPLQPARVSGGGSQLLTDQAQCPFRAFARHRLNASSPEVPARGIDPRTRGITLHRAMELVWQSLGGSGGLQRADSAALQQLVRDSVEAALRAISERSDDSAQRRHIRIEALRLENLVAQILDIERQRGFFEVVQMESRESMKLGALEFTIKLDRVDRLEDGGLAVLDFKTGSARRGDWCGARIRDAQLPLYAISRSAPVAAVAVISVKSGAVGFDGVGVDSAVLGAGPDLKIPQPDPKYFNGLGDLLQSWQAQLNALAADFMSGTAAVDPDRQACRYCDLETLCRINELQRQDRSP